MSDDFEWTITHRGENTSISDVLIGDRIDMGNGTRLGLTSDGWILHWCGVEVSVTDQYVIEMLDN